MMLTGAQILVKVLLEQGVDTVFGYPGGAVLYIYDGSTKTVIRSFTTRPATSRAHVMRLTDMRAQQAKQALCLPLPVPVRQTL